MHTVSHSPLQGRKVNKPLLLPLAAIGYSKENLKIHTGSPPFLPSLTPSHTSLPPAFPFLSLFPLPSLLLKQQLTTTGRNAAYISPASQNQLIDSIAAVIRRHVLAEVNDAGYVSVSADETTDFSHKQQLAVGIRHVKDCAIFERFLMFRIGAGSHRQWSRSTVAGCAGCCQTGQGLPH